MKAKPKTRSTMHYEEDSVSTSVLGTSVKITGRETIYLALLGVALLCLGYLLFTSNKEVSTSLSRQAELLTTEVPSLKQDHLQFHAQIQQNNEIQQQMAKALQEQNYIITLPEQKRRALNLQMPDSLRQKMRRQDD